MLLVGQFWDTFPSFRSESSSRESHFCHCNEMKFSDVIQGISKIVVTLDSEKQFSTFLRCLLSI